jgi:hypothetical protein
MLRGVKNAVMTAAIGAAECVFSLAGRQALHNVGERFIRTSGLGMGALPVAFRPEEVEYFAADAGARFDAIRDYEAALAASGSKETDNFAKRGRFLMLHQLAHLAFDRHGAAGDLAECGCWRGQSTYMLAAIARQRGASGFHVFDSFEGLSEYGEQDRGGLAPADRRTADARRRHFAADIEAVRATLAPFDFVRLHKGWIPERFPAVADRRFKLVHIDVDLYRPYMDSIEFFYPRLLDGGVMIFDDYGSAGFPGARKAVDEMQQRFRPSLSLYFPLGGSAWIK